MTEVEPTQWLSQAAILELQQQGEAAALRGDPPQSCPHAHAEDPLTRARRSMWVRGYAAGRTQRRNAP